ncbi:MAG: TlpA disulfide reductase family protein [Gammaproteobacteria bacterium]|nr:MAG: TlpA disulfide reductase family protein [Gammaproteobacteria bacterium]
MLPALKNSILLATALAALVAGYWLSQSLRTPTPTSQTAGTLIEFILPDLEGKPHRLSEWGGKVIVLNFWATWCPPCREEIPLFIDLQRKYAGRGLQVIGIAIDKKEDVAAYRAAMGINYPLLIGADAGLEIMARYGNSYGSLPYSVIINPHGEIIARKQGAYTRPELEKLIIPLFSPA